MFLNKIPEDLIFELWKYLNNESSINFLVTCKNIYNIGQKKGYINNITFNNNTDSINFINNYYKHKNLLHKIKITSNIIPHNWIFCSWPKIVILENCNFNEKISPYEITNTEYLIIKDYSRFRNKTIIDINWKMFPNLKILDIYCYDINIKNIRNFCKNLTTIKKDTIIY
tara:strand:- start:563 stop:1072 length:510 start_codon:yes stop_codon:yes gene_type:complete